MLGLAVLGSFIEFVALSALPKIVTSDFWYTSLGLISIMTTAMARPEDTVRGLRLYRTETDDEEMENGTPDPSDSFSQNLQQEDSPGPDKNESQTGTALGEAPASASKQPAGPKPLTPEETIELARTAVESGIQDTKRSLAGSEAVTDVVKPKLTIDLGHSNIIRIPEPVVDLIKDEVER